MRRVGQRRWAKAAVSAAGLALAALGVAAALGQSAPDTTWREDRREQVRDDLDDAVRKAREGKCAVVRMGTLKVGIRELTTVVLESNEGRREAVVPSFYDKDAGWRPPAPLVAELDKLPRGFYTVIHTEERYGLEWVTGVGDGGARTLEALEQQVRGRGPATARTQRDRREGSDAGDEVAPEILKTTGRFIELGQATIEGVEGRVLTVERGVMKVHTKFWLIDVNRNGKFVKPSRNVIRVAESLKAGDTVEIQYTAVDDVCIIHSLRQVE